MKFKRSTKSPFKRSSEDGFGSTDKSVGDSHSTDTASFITTVFDTRSKRSLYRPFAALLMGGVVVLVLGMFVWRLFSFQVVAGERYRDLANGNRIREVVEYAERGKIYDRNGVALAINSPGYQVRINPYQLPDDPVSRQNLYRHIATYVNLSAEEVEERAEHQGLDYVLPIAIGNKIDQQKALMLEAQVHGTNGISVDVVPTRSYVNDGGLSHILGYTSLVTENDLKQRPKLSLVDSVGRGGVEQQYDEVLRGRNGYRRYEVDALGKPIRLIASQPAEPGTDLHLTIDHQSQKELAKQVQTQMKAAGVARGSGVVMHPETGEILAMVSLPSYDNNLFARGITTSQYQKLITDSNEPLFNKAIAGGYPSGSVIKPLVAAAGLEEGVVNPNTVIVDRGYVDIVNQYDSSIVYRFYGWRRSGLGPMNVYRAIAMSSNIYFFTVGGGHGGIRGLGEERLTNYYRQFGLGEKTGIDLPSEGTGLVPDAEWKEEAKGEPWFQGDTYNISIGQGDMLISPLQMTVATNAIVNGGKIIQPRVLHHIEGQQPAQPIVKRKLNIDSNVLKTVREGMHEVTVNGATCSCRFAGVPVKFGGKSGTAETNTDANQDPHGWFTAFAPYDNPELTMAILIEKGVSGSTSAAPAVAGFLENYFKKN